MVNKRWIPWILSAGIVAFLAFTTDLAAVGQALEEAQWGRLFGFMALVTVAAYLVDSMTLVVLFRRFVAPVKVSEVLAIKGVSYLLNAINYSLAAGGMAYVLHKKRDVPFLETFSSLLWFFFVDIIALATLLSVGFLIGGDILGGASFVDQIPLVLGIIWAIVIGALIYWNLDFDFFVLGRMRDWRIFHTFKLAKLSDYPTMIVIRMVFVLVYVSMHWLLLPAFGVHIGWDSLLMYAPLITFVQVIPATVSGLGAVQGVIVGLFTAHVDPSVNDPQAVIVAYSTVIGPLMMVMRLGIAYLFMANVTKDLVATKAEVEAARQEAT